VEVAGAAVELQGEVGEAFEFAAGEAGAVRGEENPRARGGDFDGVGEQGFQIVFDLEAAAFVAAGKGRRIQDDAVELFATSGEAGKDFEHIVGKETVRLEVDGVEREIGAAAVEGFFREVDAHGLGTGERGGDGKGAGVGEGVEQSADCWPTNDGAVRALIDEQPGGVAGGEVEAVADTVFADHGFEREAGLAVEQFGRDPVGVLQRDEFAEESAMRPAVLGFPRAEAGEQRSAGGVVLVGKQQVVAEAFEPRFARGGDSMGVGLRGCEGRKQGAADPAGMRFGGWSVRKFPHGGGWRTDCKGESMRYYPRFSHHYFMRPLALSVFACVALGLHSLYAQSSDPGDLFVSAYMAVQAGEKAEQAGNLKEAVSKLRYAAQMLDQISEKNPSWQPSIIDYRKKRTAEALGRVQDRIGQVGGAKGQPAPEVAPPAAPASTARNPLPGLPDEILPTAPPATRTVRQPVPVLPQRQMVEPDLPASTPAKEVEQRLERMQKELEKVRAEAARAEREKSELAAQLVQATAARQAADKKQGELTQRAASAEAALTKAREGGESEATKQLSAELANVKKQMRELKFEADAEAEYREQLADRVRATQVKISRLSQEKAAAEQASGEVPGKIAGYEKQLDETRKEKNDLVIQLSRTQTDLKSVTAARDEALSQVAKMKEAQKQVDKLIADNTSLMARLTDAEKSINDFKTDGVKKDQEIASLRKDASSLQGQLAKAQQDSVDYQKQMADLQQRLSQANTQIAEQKSTDAKSVGERTRLLAENDVLRGIVLRGQKEEARRAQTKKLVIGELAKLESKSKVLMDQVEYLSGPIVKLTDKERALFKKPELQISDSEISIAAPLSATTSSAEPPLPTAAPPAPAPEVQTAPAAAVPPSANVASRTPPAPAPPAPAPADPSTTTAPETKPALSLDTGIRVPRTGPAPFSALPDGLTGAKPTETLLAKATTPVPSKTMPPAETAPLPENTPAKPADPKAPAENPLATNPAGTANVSSAVMNLPPELASLARQGKDEFDKGNYREAERVYEKVLTQAPNNLYTLSNLGVVYFRADKLKRAEEMFRKAIAIAPEDGFSHCTLGIVYYSQGKYDEAVTELTKALAINPKNATAHNYLGITASQKGWQEAAQKELETATALDPTYADAHFNLAVVFATQQPPNKEGARKCYKRATELGAEPDPALEQMIR